MKLKITNDITDQHTVKSNNKAVSVKTSKFKIISTFTINRDYEPRIKKPSTKLLEASIKFRLPYVNGKIREVITKGKNFITHKRYSHRNNALIVEKVVQDNAVEWIFEGAAVPRIEVKSNGFTIDYVSTVNGRVVITVRFSGTEKVVTISKDGEIMDFNPLRMGVYRDEL